MKEINNNLSTFFFKLEGGEMDTFKRVCSILFIWIMAISLIAWPTKAQAEATAMEDEKKQETTD